MKTLFNYFLLSTLIPITSILMLSLLVLQLLHWTAFNPSFYKKTLQQANVYAIIKTEGTGQTFLQIAKILPIIPVQEEVEKSIDIIFLFISGEQNTITNTKFLDLIENNEKVFQKRLEPLRTFYNITQTTLRGLYILVPLLILLTGWLFIKSWLHFLKTLALWSLLIGTFVVIIAGISTNYIPTVLAYLIPDLIWGLDSQIFVTALSEPIYYLFQQIMLGGIVLAILGVIVQIYLYLVRKSKSKNIQNKENTVLGQKKISVPVQNKNNKGVNPFDPRTFR